MVGRGVKRGERWKTPAWQSSGLGRLSRAFRFFGGNPLRQTIGLGKADRVARLEIRWPTSGTTQVFENVAVNQAIEVTEFAADYRKLDWKPVILPKAFAAAGN